MACIDGLIGTPFLSDADFRECLMDIYGEDFHYYDGDLEDSNNDIDDYIVKDCYMNNEGTMDIIVWYGEHTRDIENVVVKKS